MFQASVKITAYCFFSYAIFNKFPHVQSPCQVVYIGLTLFFLFLNKGDRKTRGWELEPYAVAIRLCISGFWYPRRSGKTIARLWLTSFLPRGWWMQTITKRNQFTFPQGEMSLKELVRIIVMSISIYLYLYLYNKLSRSQIESWFKELNPPFIWKGNWYDVGTGEENHRTTVQTFVFFLISYREILD